jgi:energy-converting hydrogenase A subunit M
VEQDCVDGSSHATVKYLWILDTMKTIHQEEAKKVEQDCVDGSSHATVKYLWILDTMKINKILDLSSVLLTGTVQ